MICVVTDYEIEKSRFEPSNYAHEEAESKFYSRFYMQLTKRPDKFYACGDKVS